MKFLLIATFKSHKTSHEVESWLKQVSPAVPPAKSAGRSGAQVAVAPSYPHLQLVSSFIIHHSSFINLAAQDCSPFPPGSYTGAVSAGQLADLGVKYCLVGHSERRRYFHETHVDVAGKILELVGQGITPVLCLSKDDIQPQFAALDDKLQRECVYVYEPPADIGGTETAPLDDIKATVKLLRSLAPGRPVLYGGSVNAGNLAGLVKLGVDGVLVSTASLEADSFIALLNTYRSLE